MTNIRKLKAKFYFPIASYFRFFANIRLKRWHPKIIVVTGSNGKTTLLHLLEAQIGTHAAYSHHANSSFGIPFDILGIPRESLEKSEWIGLFLKAPFACFKKVPREKLYIVEADCDRPNEGRYLSEFLKPDVVLWLNSIRSHGMNFEYLVREKQFETVEEAIAYEYGYFLKNCRELVIINGDSVREQKQLERTTAKIKEVTREAYLESYHLDTLKTTFRIQGIEYSLKALLPLEVFYAIAMTRELVEYLGLSFDETFSKFKLPAGRSSLFEGIKGTTLIDSSYNSNFASMKAILAMYATYPSKDKWAVIGDMLEQGEGEGEEHKKLAHLLSQYSFSHLILLGPRVCKYTNPELELTLRDTMLLNTFENPKDALDFISKHIQGGETILFKGARFMEGIIEHLLKNKKDAELLPRREEIWQARRRHFGL